jgi:hypothetical protein
MVSRIVLAAVAFWPLACAAELDLTPQVHVSELEGIRSEQTAFRNGSDLVTWTPPFGWSLSGRGSKLVLRPKEFAQADALVEVLALPSSTSLDDAFARELKEQVARSLPREATAVEWQQDEINPLLLNRHPTRKMIASYEVLGQRFTKAIWTCNFAEQQVRFHLTARAADFAKMQEPFRQSLYTWQGLK